MLPTARNVIQMYKSQYGFLNLFLIYGSMYLENDTNGGNEHAHCSL